jgi:hypothetical protein
MNMSALLLLLAIGSSSTPSPSKPAELPVIAGDYFLLGRAPQDGKVYAGRALIQQSALGIRLIEWLDNGSGEALRGTFDPQQSRIVFKSEGPGTRIVSCVAQFCDDHIKGFSCFWWIDGRPRPSEPGLEALIPEWVWPTSDGGQP